ncbi:hypothetical protein RSAG8_01845, partial [Rhizoctonia solani AG-8 WAC10335]
MLLAHRRIHLYVVSMDKLSGLSLLRRIPRVPRLGIKEFVINQIREPVKSDRPSDPKNGRACSHRVQTAHLHACFVKLNKHMHCASCRAAHSHSDIFAISTYV